MNYMRISQAVLLSGSLLLAACNEPAAPAEETDVEEEQVTEGDSDPADEPDPEVAEAEMAVVKSALAKARETGTELDPNNPDIDKIARVRITVDKPWTIWAVLNGTYEFGSPDLKCAMLLGPGESWPNGVTCEDI